MKSKILYFSLSAVPTISWAAFSLSGSSFSGFIYEIIGTIKLILPTLGLLAFIMFAWGIAKIIKNSNSPAELQAGKNYMIWAIVAIFCLVSLLGIITFVQRQFGYDHVDTGGVLLPTS
jgi:TRAP-type mannitol/chloroaromatic compound transport system permease small subunit